jgi:hypothetical protein
VVVDSVEAKTQVMVDKLVQMAAPVVVEQTPLLAVLELQAKDMLVVQATALLPVVEVVLARLETPMLKEKAVTELLQPLQAHP